MRLFLLLFPFFPLRSEHLVDLHIADDGDDERDHEEHTQLWVQYQDYGHIDDQVQEVGKQTPSKVAEDIDHLVDPFVHLGDFLAHILASMVAERKGEQLVLRLYWPEVFETDNGLKENPFLHELPQAQAESFDHEDRDHGPDDGCRHGLCAMHGRQFVEDDFHAIGPSQAQRGEDELAEKNPFDSPFLIVDEVPEVLHPVDEEAERLVFDIGFVVPVHVCSPVVKERVLFTKSAPVSRGARCILEKRQSTFSDFYNTNSTSAIGEFAQ